MQNLPPKRGRSSLPSLEGVVLGAFAVNPHRQKLQDLCLGASAKISGKAKEKWRNHVATLGQNIFLTPDCLGLPLLVHHEALQETTEIFRNVCSHDRQHCLLIRIFFPFTELKVIRCGKQNLVHSACRRLVFSVDCFFLNYQDSL